jgi:hypothetical protein
MKGTGGTFQSFLTFKIKCFSFSEFKKKMNGGKKEKKKKEKRGPPPNFSGPPNWETLFKEHPLLKEKFIVEKDAATGETVLKLNPGNVPTEDEIRLNLQLCNYAQYLQGPLFDSHDFIHGKVRKMLKYY